MFGYGGVTGDIKTSKGLVVPIPEYPPFLIIMAAALLGAKIRSPVEALPSCKGFH